MLWTLREHLGVLTDAAGPTWSVTLSIPRYAVSGPRSVAGSGPEVLPAFGVGPGILPRL